MSDYMPYSKRKRHAERAGQPVTYTYDRIPRTFRVQAVYCLIDALGHFDEQQAHYADMVDGIDHTPQNVLWNGALMLIKREHGIDRLPMESINAQRDFMQYIKSEDDDMRALDAIEIGFHCAVRTGVQTEQVEMAISELNRRFREHDLGYQFITSTSGGQIIKMSSQYVQSEVIEPAIAALGEAGFEGPLEEFLGAHREYRHGHLKDAMNQALKAFESTMKAISSRLGWKFDSTWTASKLIALMVNEGLFSESQESYFAGFRAALESGVPTLRNKQSGHGQGPAVVEVPDHVAAFALHLTASNIVYLMAAYNAKASTV